MKCSKITQVFQVENTTASTTHAAIKDGTTQLSLTVEGKLLMALATSKVRKMVLLQILEKSFLQVCLSTVWPIVLIVYFRKQLENSK